MQQQSQQQQIRQCLQKCTYWSDRAVQRDPDTYYKTTSWKKATKYAEKASAIYNTLPLSVKRSYKWTPVEDRILLRGCPILEQSSSSFTDNPTNTQKHQEEQQEKEQEEAQRLLDPFEELQRAQTAVLQMQKHIDVLQAELDQAHDKHVKKMTQNLCGQIRQLQEEKQHLQMQIQNLEDDVVFHKRKWEKMQERWTQRLQTVQDMEQKYDTLSADKEELEKQVQSLDFYRQFIVRISEIMTEEQKGIMKLFVDKITF